MKKERPKAERIEAKTKRKVLTHLGSLAFAHTRNGNLSKKKGGGRKDPGVLGVEKVFEERKGGRRLSVLGKENFGGLFVSNHFYSRIEKRRKGKKGLGFCQVVKGALSGGGGKRGVGGFVGEAVQGGGGGGKAPETRHRRAPGAPALREGGAREISE